MVNNRSDSLNAVFQALADPTRRAMLALLADGERNVGELAAPFSMSLAGASKHIKTLEQAGLLTREKQGRIHVCRLSTDTMAEAMAWLKRYEVFWNERLDALEQALRQGD